MTLLAPFALWGLLGLAVPLLLHLRRRRVGRTIQVGSLKHLETLPTAERRGPRVRDPLRLLLRLCILGLVVLLLAEPSWPGPTGNARGVILLDRSASPALRDSLAKGGDLVVADLSRPWDAIASADDSLPPGIPLTIVATTSSDRFSGPRPVVGRRVTWIDGNATPPIAPAITPPVGAISPLERRALDAAIAATAEIFGALRDTAGWEGRLPLWWRDSLEVPAFPDAVARTLIPARALPRSTPLALAQVTPRVVERPGSRSNAIDLHWWIWGAALVLFLVERLWARRLEETA